MDKLATRIKIQQILKDLKLMYFNDYRYILKFSFTLTQDDIFLRLLYRAFNQRKFQYKLLTLSSKCNLEKDLQPILYNIYRRNLDVETQKYSVPRHEFLHAVVDHLETIPELPPIPEERRWICFKPPLVDSRTKILFIFDTSDTILKRTYTCGCKSYYL